MAETNTPSTSELELLDVEDLKSGPRISEAPAPLPPSKPAGSLVPVPPPPPPRLRPQPLKPTRPPLESQRPTREELSYEEFATQHKRPLASNAKILVKHFEEELLNHPSAEQTARLHYELGRLFENHLDNAGAALEHYQKAYAASPDFLPALRDARRLLIAKTDYHAALPFFDAEIALTSHPHDKAKLLYRKGVLFEEHVRNVALAKEVYLEALALSPDNHSILNALERCFRNTQDWEDLATIYERRANIVKDDPNYCASQLFLRGKLAETKQNNLELAAEFYHAALRIDPGHHGAISSLKRLHHTHQRWHELCNILHHETEQTHDIKLKVTDWLEIAHVSLTKLKDLDRAVKSLKMASAVSGDDPVILHRLANLYEETGLYEDAISAWSLWADAETDNPEIVHIAQHVGGLAERQLKNEELAIHWYERALHLRPDYDPAFQALSNLYTARSDWDALIGINLQIAHASDDPSIRAHSHARVADLLETKLDELDDAIEQHLRALSFIPGYDPSLKALDRLYRVTGKFVELAQLHERLLDAATDNHRKIAILFTIGALYEEKINDHEHAAQVYQRILKLDPTNLNAIHALQRAAQNHQDYKTLITALHTEATITKDSRIGIELRHRAAEIYANHLQDTSQAILEFRQVLKTSPNYLPALRGLRRLYYQAGRWNDVIDTYQLELNAATTSEQKAELHYQIGTLYEKSMGKTREAVENYRRALELDVKHTESLMSLESLSRKHSQWEQLAEVLLLKLKHHSDEAEKAFTSLDLGELYEERLGDHVKAIHAYSEALFLKPSLHTANTSLIRLHYANEDWRKLIEDLQQFSSSTTDKNLAVEGLTQQGEVWTERLKDPTKATACFQTALEQRPNHLEAFHALEQLYLQGGHNEELKALYPQWIKALRDPLLRVAQWREITRGFVPEAVQGSQAAVIQQSAFEILKTFEQDEDALMLLEFLALKTGDSGLLVEIEGLLSKIAPTPAMASLHLLRLAEALESSNHPDAVNVYSAAAKKDPQNLGALHGFVRLAETGADPTFTVEAKRLLAKASLNPEQAATHLVDSARIHMDQLENPVEALKDLTHALRLWPQHTVGIDRLELLLSSAGQHRQLTEMLSDVAIAISNPQQSASLWLRIAHIHSKKEGDIASAIHALEKALQAWPEHLEAILELAAIYKADRQWKPAVELLLRAIRLSKEPSMLLQYHAEVAQLSLEHLGDSVTARQHLERALHIDANHHQALAQLAELQLASGETTAALNTASRLARIAQSDHEKAIALNCLGKLHMVTGEAEKALHCYFEALNLGGPTEPLLTSFKQLTQESNQWDYFIQALENFLKHTPSDVALIATAYRELAWVHHYKRERTEVAIDTLRMGIAKTHGDLGLRKILVQRLREANQPAEAIDELHQILQTDVTLTDMWRELAKLYLVSHRPTEARLAIQPVLVLGTATSPDIDLSQSTPLRPAEGLPASLNFERLQSLAEFPLNSKNATQLLRALRSGIGKLFPPDLDGYGAWEKLSLRGDRSIVGLVRKVAEILDIQEFDLYLHSARSRGVGIELGDIPIVLIPTDIEEHTRSKQTFLIAYALAKIALQLEATAKLMPRELQILLAAASRGVTPSYGAGLTAEEVMDEQSKRLFRALSRKARKATEEAAASYVAGQEVDFMAWVAAIEQAAYRIAALISDDLPGSIDLIRRSRRDLSRLQGGSLVHQCPEVRDLMAFWTSETAMQLRRTMGLI